MLPRVLPSGRLGWFQTIIVWVSGTGQFCKKTAVPRSNEVTPTNMPDNAMPSSDDLHTSDQAESEPKVTATTGKTVLLVDDDIEIIEAARYALEGAGHNVVVARDGNQGLALAERENPDLIILDMMMPKRSGFLVLEKLRRLRSELLPVIMITGNEGSRHKAYAELLGVSDYIRKPFPMERLISSVDKLIGS